MFSIIVPVFNGEKYLKQCIESVLHQTFSEWELILVDDGSTDASAEIINEYVQNHSKIKKITINNSGRYYARRAGFEIAEKEYIICLDCDDYWEKGCLETIYQEIKKYNADIVMFAAKTFGTDRLETVIKNNFSNVSKVIEKKHIYRNIMSTYELNSMCLKAFRKKLLNEEYIDLKDFSGRCIGEDKVQVLQIITAAQVVVNIPDILYNYRKTETSTMASINPNNIQKYLANEVFDILYRYMKIWGMTDKKSEKMMATHYFTQFMNVYYYFRKRRKNEPDKEWLNYSWKSAFWKKAKKYIFNNYLSYRDKCKLRLLLISAK